MKYFLIALLLVSTTCQAKTIMDRDGRLEEHALKHNLAMDKMRLQIEKYKVDKNYQEVRIV